MHRQTWEWSKGPRGDSQRAVAWIESAASSVRRARHHVHSRRIDRCLHALTALLLAWLLPSLASAEPRRRVREPPRRFTGRLQMLSGATLALPEHFDSSRPLVAYVPAEAEVAIRIAGLLSVGLGGSGWLAPFSLTTCSAAPSPRANALAAFATARLDFNNSRDGSWWSPWLALRGGVVGQGGVGSGDPCQERFALGLYLGPRLGADLWMGNAAVTFAVGYDYLPRADGIAIQTGLTLPLF